MDMLIYIKRKLPVIFFLCLSISLYSLSPKETYSQTSYTIDSDGVDLKDFQYFFNEVRFSIYLIRERNIFGKEKIDYEQLIDNKAIKGHVNFYIATELDLYYSFLVLEDKIIFQEIHDENTRYNKGQRYDRWYIYSNGKLFLYNDDETYTYLKDGMFLEGKAIKEILDDMNEGFEYFKINKRVK